MARRDVRRVLASIARIGATVIATSVITAAALTVLTPEPAATTARPVVIVEGDRLYPCSVGDAPSVVYNDHEAFLADYARLRADLLDLRHAIDYDASHSGNVSPSVHEWADHADPGAFGGGRKP